MFEAVIFDFDGTLADTRKAILISFHKALKSVNGDVEDEIIERLIGIGAKKTLEEILKKKAIKFDDVLIDRLVEIKIQTEIEVTDQVNIFPGVKELLSVLRGKKQLVLASMNNRRVIDHMISGLGLKGYFQMIVTAEDINKPKPDPEIFLRAAKGIGISPKECVVLEDSIFGVEAAKAAGMSCIAVLTGAYNKQELSKANPDLIVDSLERKEEILKFISE